MAIINCHQTIGQSNCHQQRSLRRRKKTTNSIGTFRPGLGRVGTQWTQQNQTVLLLLAPHNHGNLVFLCEKRHYGLCVCSTSLHLWSHSRHAQDIALNVTHSSSSKSPRPAWPVCSKLPAQCPAWLLVPTFIPWETHLCELQENQSHPWLWSPYSRCSQIHLSCSPSHFLHSSLIFLFPSLHLPEIPSETLAAILHPQILIWNSSPNSCALPQPIANNTTQHALTWRVVSNHCSPKPTTSLTPHLKQALPGGLCPIYSAAVAWCW